MRDFVRTDLPELVVLADRARELLARSSVPFAILAGIGADRLSGDAVRALAFAILEVAPIERSPRPYDLEQFLGPAVGLLVARRAGGIGGALGYLAYSGTVLVLAWTARALTCAGILSQGQLGSATFCAYGPLDLLTGALPMFLGLAIGALVARSVATAPRAGANALLEAAGAYAGALVLLAFGARAFAYQPLGVAPEQVAYMVGATLVSAIVAGGICAVRSRVPLRTGALLAAALIALWLYPLGWSQLATSARADWPERPELFLVGLPLLGAAMIPLVAGVARRSLRGSR